MTHEAEILLNRYLELKSKLAELEEELEQLKPAVFDLTDDLARENGEKFFAHNGFIFQAQHRTTYNYSASIAALEQQLREQRKREEANGTATIKSQSGFVRVSQDKNFQP
jgi:hypothetical protein